MKGLRKYIPPFATDQSGAVSVVYELGGCTVVIDAGGCTGNICSFDEPRWTYKKSAIFSATLRDMDAILGRDDLLIEKIGDAIGSAEYNFVTLVGTPVPAVIGTDYNGLKHIIETKYKLPVVSVETNGMKQYDSGVSSAFVNLFRTFAEKTALPSFDIGILGATPEDMLPDITPEKLKNLLGQAGYSRSVCYGTDSDGIDAFRAAPNAKVNWVVAPAGIAAAEYLEKEYGIPWITGLPLTNTGATAIIQKISSYMYEDCICEHHTIKKDSVPSSYDVAPPWLSESSVRGKRALVIHQQIIANELRDILEREQRFDKIDVATWFTEDERLKRPGDVRFSEEDDFSSYVKANGYDTIIGDNLFRRALPFFTGRYLSFPHFAVSGRSFLTERISK